MAELRAFIWTPGDGTVDMADFLSSHNVDYGADLFGRIAAVSRDGRRLLFEGMTAAYERRRAVIRIDPDAVFASGFEPN